MRWVVRLIWAIALIVAVVTLYPSDPGEALIRLPGVGTFQTTPVVLLLGMFVLFVLIVLFFQLTHWLVRLPWAISQKIRENRNLRADERLLTGWTWLSTGGYQEALNLAQKTHRSGLSLNEAALLAARAEMKMDHYDESAQWLSKVDTHIPRHQLLKGIMQAKWHLHRNEQKEALQVIADIEKQSGFNSVIGRFRIQAYYQDKSFDDMLKLSRQLFKKGLAPQSDYDLWRHQARSGELKQLADNLSTSPKARTQAINEWWKKLEADEHTNVALLHSVHSLIRSLFTQEFAESSAQEIAQAQEWAMEWLEEQIGRTLPLLITTESLSTNRERAERASSFAQLAETYAVYAPELDRAINQCLQWLVLAPENVSLLRTLARLYERRELWGNAIRYYETALSFEAHPPTILRLRAIYQRLGQSNKALEWQNRLIDKINHD